MQKLIIHNFGPLQNVELEVKDFMVFIGPQATGKSTVAKLVYYFKDISNDIWELLRDFCYFKAVFPELYHTYLEIRLKDKIIEMFGGHIVNSSQTRLYFEYDADKNIEIEIKDNIFKINISTSLATYIESLFEEVRIFRLDILKQYYFTKSQRRGNNVIDEQLLNELSPEATDKMYHFLNEIADKIYPIFQNKVRFLNFIPAGRIISAIKGSSGSNDYFLNLFDGQGKGYYQIQKMSEFSQENHSLRTKKIIDYYLKIVRNIIKEDITVYNNYPFALTINEMYVYPPFLSSGQQEAIPMILRLLEFISVEKPIFSIIEEPEAHLYPVAQKYIVDLITLFFHSNAHNQLIITTHSPYILTSLNNLLYAHKMAQSNPEATEKIIPKELWLDINRFAAYYMSDGKIEPIVDREDTHLIYAERLDDVSAQINETYYQLLDLES